MKETIDMTRTDVRLVVSAAQANVNAVRRSRIGNFCLRYGAMFYPSVATPRLLLEAISIGNLDADEIDAMIMLSHADAIAVFNYCGAHERDVKIVEDDARRWRNRRSVEA